jgi:hypothetical protein
LWLILGVNFDCFFEGKKRTKKKRKKQKKEKKNNSRFKLRVLVGRGDGILRGIWVGYHEGECCTELYSM